MLAKDRVVVSKLWITGYWLWSRLSYICDCCKSMKNCWDWAFSLCGLEAGLPTFQLPMFEKCDSVPEKRFVQHVCLRNSCLWNLSLQSLPELEVTESGSTLHQLCTMVASCPSPRWICRIKPVSCREADSCLSQWSFDWILFGDWLWHLAMSAPCFHVTKATQQWRIVEIEFLAFVGWKWGCQPFSCPCLKNVIHCPKEICSTCLSKESMPCVKIQASTPCQRLEVREICSTLHQLCIMVASVASCLQKIELWYPRFGLQAIDCDLGCLMYASLQVNEELSRLSF